MRAPLAPRSGRWGGAGARHELGGQDDRLLRLARPVGEEEAHGLGAHRGAGLADSGQRRDEGLGEVNVVEARDGQVARDAQPCLVRGGDEAHGALVVGAGDGGGAGVKGHEGGEAAAARGKVEAALQFERRVEGAEIAVSMVALAVCVTLLLQATTAGYAARRLGLFDSARSG